MKRTDRKSAHTQLLQTNTCHLFLLYHLLPTITSSKVHFQHTKYTALSTSATRSNLDKNHTVTDVAQHACTPLFTTRYTHDDGQDHMHTSVP
uniref:Uncharacterized protein n=1 Tax=Rhipicephalus zambeziensis TaxID=60191 RepID=A0A224Y4X7_9ACAR